MTKTEARDKKMMRALRRDPDPARVAKQFGVNESTVYRAIKRQGVELKLLRAIDRRRPGKEQACYQYLYNNEVPMSEIAKKFGVSVSYVSQQLSKKQVA